MKSNKAHIVYRHATVKDAHALVDYRIRFLNELLNHPENEDTEILRKSLREYFSTAIPSGEFIGWVAEYYGRIIATAGMVVWRKPAIYGAESGKLGYLLNFYTIPEARRKGIAARLLNELIKDAKSLELRYLHLHASEDGISIYRKAGFTEPPRPELELTL